MLTVTTRKKTKASSSLNKWSTITAPDSRLAGEIEETTFACLNRTIVVITKFECKRRSMTAAASAFVPSSYAVRGRGDRHLSFGVKVQGRQPHPVGIDSIALSGNPRILDDGVAVTRGQRKPCGTSSSALPMTMTASEAVEVAAAAASPATTFEPVLPDAGTLVGFIAVALLSAIAVWVWANQVVPVSRTNLAISKRSGAVGSYLDELAQTAESDTIGGVDVTTTFSTESSAAPLADDDDGDSSVALGTSSINVDDGRDFERWLFTDWLQQRKNKNKSNKKSGRQKEPALPILKNAKWNSGDNPVLAASALIGVGVVASAVLEKVTSSFP